MKREFVMLCHKYFPKQHFISNWYLSEKLDGLRAFWDGGITRGLPCERIPWANVEKNYRLKEEVFSTGLWTRLAHPIYAPKWFLDKLPNFFLDGELHCPTGSWQTLSSTVKKFTPDDTAWSKIVYSVFDSPSPDIMFADGIIKTTNFKKTFKNIPTWIKQFDLLNFDGEKSFQFMYEKLTIRIQDDINFKVHNQIELPLRNYQNVLEANLKEIIDKGGEGIVLRAPNSVWKPERSHLLLKYKPFNDDEGIVIGYVWGRKTDLGSKLLGKMGALILDYRGKILELSGFTDAEREIRSLFDNVDLMKVAEDQAGKAINKYEFMSPHFKLGDIVTFRYRELSDSGIPKEARYLRKPI